jgi:AcrR family transcriptional regulator
LRGRDAHHACSLGALIAGAHNESLGITKTFVQPAQAATPAREPGLGERKKADLKRRIADAALALLRERGFERTPIEEIVKGVEASQPTFYKYCPSKGAILREHGMTTFGALIEAELARRAFGSGANAALSARWRGR